jgi:hypothetical protein
MFTADINKSRESLIEVEVEVRRVCDVEEFEILMSRYDDPKRMH